MIGLQDLVIKQNIKIPILAKEIGVHESTLWEWLRKEKVPKKYLKFLAERFNVEESYFNKQFDNLTTYKPRLRGSKNDYKIMDDYVIIYIYRKNGEILEAYIDLEDLDKFFKWEYSWGANKNSKNYYYVITNIYHNKRDGISPQTMYLHQYILDYPEDCDIDHRNHNELDNRKNNLRISPHDNNNKNRKSKNSNNKSGYRNVYWNTKDERWVVTLQIEGKRKIEGKRREFGRFKFDDLDKAGARAEEMRQLHYKEYAGKN